MTLTPLLRIDDFNATPSSREARALGEVFIGLSGELLGRGGRLRRLADDIERGEADHLEARALLREARLYLGPSVKEGRETHAPEQLKPGGTGKT